ncbi:MAG: hypothetical protein LBI19_00225 [Oscillospiraceae bacterium]|jgi:FSR family fosmidomycin resistance protein-like MFS transporter|nr:hypothetical protein [Oscillospiraceae bacterium]
MPKRVVTVYSAAHFFIDFACAFLMFRSITAAPDWALCILLYNFCAFALQMPLGILADKWSRNYITAAAGCIFVCAAYGLTAAPIIAAAAAGVGNAMFHIGGGIDVLNVSKGKSGALGVFVSPGALGVYFGTVLGKGDSPLAVPILLALLAAAGLIAALCRAVPRNAPFSLGGGNISRKILLAIALGLFLIVCLRSYVGLTLDFPWKSAGYWGTALLCATVLGKTAGGFIADRFGAVRVGFLALGLAAALFLFPSVPAAGVGAMLLLNVTMPVTLWGMVKLFPNAKGFAFGLLTFALFIGFLPVYFS